MMSDIEDAFLDGPRVILLQAADARVTTVDLSTGDVVWRFGRRGAGPGEFAAPISLFARIGSGVGVVDPRQGRISLIDSSGHLVGSISGELLEKEPHNVCDVGTRGLLAIRLPGLDVARAYVHGAIVIRDSLVWPRTLMNTEYVYRQGLFARSRNGRCVVFAMRGEFFAEFDSETAKPIRFFRYLDGFDFPKMVEQRGRLVPEVFRTSASSAAVSDNVLFVLKGGEGKSSGRIVDAYSIDDGGFLYSFALPRSSYKIDVDAGRLMVLEWPDSGSRLDIYQLPTAPEGRQ